MSILTVSNVAKSYGSIQLFEHVTFSIGTGHKMGFVGRNGCGKTTLLRILLGEELPEASVTDGKSLLPRISIASGRRLGYLRQESPVNPDHSIKEEAESVFEPLRKMADEISALELSMSHLKTGDETDLALANYAMLRDQFDAAGGYRYAADVDNVLEKLGFSSSDLTKQVSSCSGGEQTRLALAKIVLSKPDVLILDEPTNHLDIKATEWLENYLNVYEGAVILVSHDRYFLDAVVDSIGELDNQTLTVYTGNYSQYRRQKSEKTQREQSRYKQQQAEIDRLEEIIKRNQGADSTQSRMRHRIQGRIDRTDRVVRPQIDNSRIAANIDSDSAGRIGREVLRLTDLTMCYGNRALFNDLSAVIERGDRVGLIGPNGSGKTTLVKIILGALQPTDGSILFGNNVRPAYFSQHAADSLDAGQTVVDSLLDIVDMTETEARNYLARFLFTGDDVFKTVSMLSGGEKNKLALALMIIEPCNLLILDEPTNHLDITSCEALTEMLTHYNGSLLLVSHDRYLLNSVTTKTLALGKADSVSIFEGNYAAWRDMEQRISENVEQRVKRTGSHREGSKNSPAALSGSNRIEPAPMNARDLSKARAKAQADILRVEQSILALERAIESIELKLAQPTDSVAEMISAAAEHTQLQDELSSALNEWEKTVHYEESLARTSLANTQDRSLDRSR